MGSNETYKDIVRLGSRGTVKLGNEHPTWNGCVKHCRMPEAVGIEGRLGY